MMPALQQKPHFKPSEPAEALISPLESARYTTDLLENLRKMATGQGHVVLAHLLELAQMEARIIARDCKKPRAMSD
jgi:hypothetical protein